MTTPPGWYPDPGYTGSGPAPERWWDGASWTGYARPAGETGAMPAPPAVPPGMPPGEGGVARMLTTGAPPPAPAGRGPLVAALVVGGLLAVALVVTGVLLGSGSGPGEQAAPTSGAQNGSGSGEGEGEDEDEDEDEGEDPGSGPDSAGEGLTRTAVGGAALPLLDGWSDDSREDLASVSIGPHPCPAEESLQCVDAGAHLLSAPDGFSPQELAETDIALNVSEAYDETSYEGVTGSEETLAEEVTVAGLPGYRVRWRVETGAGVSAHVESVAFPAPGDPSRLLLLRIGFDTGGDAPPTADMDRIVAGIQAVSGGPRTDV